MTDEDNDETFVYDQDRQLLKFHGRTLPAMKNWEASEDEATKNIRGFSPHFHRRALMKFENGWSLSIVWGSLTYSTNHNHPFGYSLSSRVEPEFIEEPWTVEVGVLCPEPKRIETTIELPRLEYKDVVSEAASIPHTLTLAEWEDGDSVGAYITPARLSEIADYVMTIPSDIDLGDVLIPGPQGGPTAHTYMKALFGDGEQT